MRKALDGFRGGFRIGGRTISNLRYADDILVIATSPEELQELVNRVESAANEYGLKINASKTKVMTNTDRVLKIYVVDGVLRQVDNFTYLGSKISSDAKCSDDIKSRLAMGMAVMVKLTKVWKNKSISTQTKIRLMKSLVWSVATYGCESWVLKKSEENQIQSFENKCIRKLLRISWTLKLTTESIGLPELLQSSWVPSKLANSLILVTSSGSPKIAWKKPSCWVTWRDIVAGADHALAGLTIFFLGPTFLDLTSSPLHAISGSGEL